LAPGANQALLHLSLRAGWDSGGCFFGGYMLEIRGKPLCSRKSNESNLIVEEWLYLQKSSGTDLLLFLLPK
jgi:hypothetical protein